MIHLCHAEGCSTRVPPKFLMCGPHWRMVPKPRQLEIWRHYRTGQEIDKRPSLDYLSVMKAAIDTVARLGRSQGSLL